MLCAEYRKEYIYFKQDDFAGTAGNTNNFVLGTLYDPDAFEVKEAFGELRIPILADMTFFEELTLSGAARVADYTAFFYMGELVEFDRTDVLFTKPSNQRTEDYITGRFG